MIAEKPFCCAPKKSRSVVYFFLILFDQKTTPNNINMKFIIFPLLGLIALTYLLIISYKSRWFLKDWSSQSPLSRVSTIKYYSWIVILIITMVCLLHKGIMDFFSN